MDIAKSIAKTRLVYGVGVNDADYYTQTTVNGKKIRCPFYDRWNSMLCRCYSEKLHYRVPTYAGCEVCEEWTTSFMAFRAWMQTQDWVGKELDKDLIGNGKLYSPENCVFVSCGLNSLFIDSGASRGEHPLGVSWNKRDRKYQATIRVNGKTKNLGYFTSASDAHQAWRKAKIEIANGFLASETNPRVRYAIECRIAKLRTIKASN